MNRRHLMQLLVLGATVAETTACISDHKTPKGWKRVSIGHANFNVPKEWQKVDIPGDAAVTGWDYAMQDKSEFYDDDLRCRLLVMSHGTGDIFENPPTDAKSMALALAGGEIFGGGTALKPQKLNEGPGELWQLNYRASTSTSDDAGEKDYAFVAQNTNGGPIAVLGLTGPGISDEILNKFSKGIRVDND